MFFKIGLNIVTNFLNLFIAVEWKNMNISFSLTTCSKHSELTYKLQLVFKRGQLPFHIF